MRLSEYTDYTLRVLMHCATRTDEQITIAGMADELRLSKNHLMKIVNDLARQGVLETTRGRGGGIRLGKPADAINVGAVVRAAETDFKLVECFDPDTDECTLTPGCKLKAVLRNALRAYLEQLDGVSLADIATPLRNRGLPAVAVVAPPRRGATNSR